MPLYEYLCENCGERFEAMQKFSDGPLTSHEKCGGGPVQRLLSVPALQFKGSGWYVNDYAKSGSSGTASGSGSGDAAKPAASSSGKSESSSSSGTPAPAAASSDSSNSKK